MKQLGNLSIVCAKRPDVLMQVYGGRVSVHVGEGPERTRMDAAWDDDKMIQLIIRELNFGRYAAPSRGKAADGRNAAMTDFQNDMYRRYLASGQAEKAEAFRQAGADQRGAELAQTEAEVREAVELHVYCDMCLSDIQSACRRRGVKLRKSRSRMEAALIEALVKERMEKL